MQILRSRYNNPISQFDVVLRKKEKFFIFSGDYDTSDGTVIRDYIDGSNLVNAHVRISEPSGAIGCIVSVHEMRRSGRRYGNLGYQGLEE